MLSLFVQGLGYKDTNSGRNNLLFVTNFVVYLVITFVNFIKV